MIKTVAYIGGLPYIPKFDRVWGGGIATDYCYIKSFEDDPEYRIVCLPKPHSANLDNQRKFLAETDYDILHVDNPPAVDVMFLNNLGPPDIIGPIANSPVKEYKNWVCPYSEEWFYSAKVIRLNDFQERQCPERITLVTHGVDTEMLKPGPVGNRRVVLWAGDTKRGAKNFDMWEEIQKLPPPEGYEYRTMGGYNVADYWAALDDVAILVNTSASETFCSAAFEAMARGVPVIWRKGLQGGVHEDAGIRVEYDSPSYREAMEPVLASWETHSHEARSYVENHCTLKHMRDSYAAVFNQIKK